MTLPLYQLRHVLGDGNSGTVYCAQRRSNEELVAVKIFASEGGDFGSLEIERHAYSLIAGINASRCTAFVSIIDYDAEGPHPYIAFPMLGCSLRSLSQLGVWPLPSADTLHMLRQLVDGIEFLHDTSITHADIKPENILLLSSATVRGTEGTEPSLKLVDTSLRIIDFADARFGTGFFYGLAGTEQYRAPEITMGIAWTTTVDWFALGCVFTELLTGRPLFPHMGEVPVARLAALRRVLGGLPGHMVKQTSGRFGQALRENVDGTYSVLFARRNTVDAVRHKQIQRLEPLETSVRTAYLTLCTILLQLDPLARTNVADAIRQEMTYVA